MVHNDQRQYQVIMQGNDRQVVCASNSSWVVLVRGSLWQRRNWNLNLCCSRHHVFLQISIKNLVRQLLLLSQSLISLCTECALYSVQCCQCGTVLPAWHVLHTMTDWSEPSSGRISHYKLVILQPSWCVGYNCGKQYYIIYIIFYGIT